MLLKKDEIQNTLEKAKRAFPNFTDWEFNNEMDGGEYFGFSMWGRFAPDPEELMPRFFYVTLDTYEENWRGHLSIGQHCYLWSSADFGDAVLLDTGDCKTLDEAITGLKAKIRHLFDAFLEE